MKPKSYCGLLGKERFATQGDAQRAARRMERAGKGTPSVYWCEFCHSWHLTHYDYHRCKEVRQSLDAQYGKPKREPRDMKIIIDNAYVPDGTSVSIKQLDDGGEQLQLLLFDEEDKCLDARFTYEQGLELIEAVKMQLGKMNPNNNNQ